MLKNIPSQYTILLAAILIFCSLSLKAQADSIPPIQDSILSVSTEVLIPIQQNKDTVVNRNGKKKFQLNNLPYIMDDLMFIGGLNQTTLAYSIEHRDINYGGGFHFGAEAYLPILEKAFMHFGVSYVMRSFSISDRRYMMHNLEFPLIFAYELPEFRRFDWRFLLGFQVNGNINSTERGDFESGNGNYRYRADAFRTFDFGLTAGLSGEYRDFYLRFRTYIGTLSLIEKDSATTAFFQMDFGYFLFRKFRNLNF